MENKFTICEREFEIRKPVLAQLSQLKKLLKIDLAKGLKESESKELLNDLDNLSKFCAIILCEKGKNLKDKDLSEVTDLIAYNCTVEELTPMFNFFSKLMNPTSKSGVKAEAPPEVVADPAPADQAEKS